MGMAAAAGPGVAFGAAVRPGAVAEQLTVPESVNVPFPGMPAGINCQLYELARSVSSR